MTILIQSGDPGRVKTPPFQRRRSRAAATTEFGAALDALGIPQTQVAGLFSVSTRHIRRWRSGARRVPRGVAIVIRLLAIEAISIGQIPNGP